MLTRTTLFLSNRSQAVRLPKAVAFDASLKDVVIIPDGASHNRACECRMGRFLCRAGHATA